MAEKNKTEEFAARMMSGVQEGMLMAGVSLGARLGLFDVLSKLEQPATSQDIATKAGLRERSVRLLNSQ